VLEQSPPRAYAAGEVLFRQGDDADSALLVVEGELSVSVSAPEGERLVGTVGAWDVVGETALYAVGEHRSATVRARRDSTCLPVSRAMVRDAPDNAVLAAIEYHLLHTLTHRIRSTNQGIQDAWRELEAPGDSAAPSRVVLAELFGGSQ
jgi:CRP-like cAMP-binding protein